MTAIPELLRNNSIGGGRGIITILGLWNTMQFLMKTQMRVELQS